MLTATVIRCETVTRSSSYEDTSLCVYREGRCHYTTIFEPLGELMVIVRLLRHELLRTQSSVLTIAGYEMRLDTA